MDKGEIIIYQTEDGKSSLEVKLREDTVWLTHQQISLLFDRDRSVITKHINNIFKSNELDEKSNVQKMHIPNSDKMVKFYNLTVIRSPSPLWRKSRRTPSLKHHSKGTSSIVMDAFPRSMVG